MPVGIEVSSASPSAADLGGSRLFRNGLTGGHVLLIFCAFFGVIFAVSAIFAYFALTTYPGEEANAYARGLKYNQTLASTARIQERGWHATARYDGGRLSVALTDKSGAAIADEEMEAQVRRPATARFDKTMSLREDAPGAYAGAVALDDGVWDVVLRVGRGPDGQPYTETLRLWAGPRP